MQRPENCPFLPDLRAHWNRDLDEAHTTALEAHLAGCRICRAEHQALERLSLLINESPADALAPPQEHERLKQALLERCARSLATAADRPAPDAAGLRNGREQLSRDPGVPTRYWVRRAPRLRWAIALALALATGLLVRNPATYGDPLQDAISAFAETRNWKTWHFRSVSPDGRTEERWTRLPDALRNEVRRGNVLEEILAQKGNESWVYLPQRKLAARGPVKMLVVGGYVTPLDELKRLQPEAQRVGGLAVRERRDRAADGRPVRVIDIEIDVEKHYRGDPSLKGVKIVHHRVVLDARTGQLLKWEHVNRGLSAETISYNTPLPDSLFTLKPPPDVKVVEVPDWWQTRRNQSVGRGTNDRWAVTVHAVDRAANGDVWLTASATPRSGNSSGTTTRPGWSPAGMILTDAQGRVYVQFICLYKKQWPPHVALIGFTPLEPIRQGDSPPKRFTAKLLPEHRHHEGNDHTGEWVIIPDVPAPPPGEWIRPLLSPMDVPQAQEMPEYEKSRQERARRAYRDGKG